MALMMSLREINCALERNNFAHEYMNEYMMMLSNQGMYAIRHMLTYFPQRALGFAKKAFQRRFCWSLLSWFYHHVILRLRTQYLKKWKRCQTLINTHKHTM